MNNITLLNSTKVPKVDLLVCEIINLLEQSFPNRIRGYYLEGSYANYSAVATSDIDMRVVFKGKLEAEERQQFAQYLESYQQMCSIELGITPDSEEALFRIGAVRFQKASLLMYGEDIRAQVPLKSIDDFIRDNMHFQYRLLARIRGNPEVLRFPLDYPDPAGEFYGYDRRPIRADGIIKYGTKDLVLNVLCPATALIALTAKQYVVSKQDCVTQYRRWINDEWAPLIEAVYQQCRCQWNYLVPSDADDRKQLRRLCVHEVTPSEYRALMSENHFLEHYKAYLLSELQHTDDAYKLYTVKRLGQIIYSDRAVVIALEKMRNSNNQEIKLQVDATLQHY